MIEKAEVKSDDTENFKKVVQAVKEYIFQTHKFPSKTQVAGLAHIPKAKCNTIVDRLIHDRQLCSVFGGGKANPEVVLPYDMLQEMLMRQKTPDWMSDGFGFPQKAQTESKIDELKKEIIRYDMFERLLYRTHTPLEEAVAFTLKWLGFSDVHHHTENTDYADVTFEYNNTKALLEIEGTTKQGDKPKILQLEGWIKTEIEKDEREPSQIQGFFVVNHYREDNPKTRGDPLTKHAKKYLNHYRFRFFTTHYLYQIAKQVEEEELSREEAQKKVWEGEKTQ